MGSKLLLRLGGERLLLLLGHMVVAGVGKVIVTIEAILFTFHHLVCYSLIFAYFGLFFDIEEGDKVGRAWRLFFGKTAEAGSETELIELVAEEVCLGLEHAKFAAGCGARASLSVNESDGRVDDGRLGGSANRGEIGKEGSEVEETAV